MAETRREAYQYIPDAILAQQARVAEAEAWARKQTADIAQRWGDLHLQDAMDSLGALVGQQPTPGLTADAGNRDAYWSDQPAPPPPDPMAVGAEGDRPASEFQAPPPDQGIDVGQRYPGPDVTAPITPQDVGQTPAPVMRPEYQRISEGRPQPADIPALLDVPNRVGFQTAEALATGQDPGQALLGMGTTGGTQARGADLLAAAGVPEGPARDEGGKILDAALQWTNALPGITLVGNQSLVNQLVVQPLGAVIGAEAAGTVGEMIAGDTGRAVGEQLGGIAGAGLAGARMSAIERDPATQRLGLVPGGGGLPGGPVPAPAPGAGAAAIDKTNKMFAEGASHAAQPLQQRLGALGTSLTRAVTDAGVDLSNLEKDAARTLGRPLRADEMASVQSRLNPFYTARIRVDDALKPVLSDVSDADYEAVRNALTWRGNVDVAAAKGNAQRAFSGGLDAAESQAALAEQARRLGPQRAADVDSRVQAVVDFNKAELERDVEAGLVSRDQADEWLRQYPNYTPVVISDYLKEQGRAIGSGKSLNVQGTGYTSLTTEGTARARIDPVAATVDAAYQGEALRRQNTAWRALHDMIQSTPEMADRFQVTKGGYTGATKYENSVSGFIDGERYTITTPFPEIAKAIRQEAGGVSIAGWNTAMALYKELITGRNPTFLVGNAAIDAPIAVLNTAIREGGAQHILPIAVDLFKGYADAFTGILSGQYTGKATKAYLEGGGGMGFYAAPSATSGAKEVARLRRSSVIDVSSAGDLARLAKDLVTLEWVKGLGERVELGPRAMAYQRALERGATPTQAVLNGRTVTVDFAQGGTVAKLVNSFVPFFNPAVQGLAQGATIVKDNPRGALLTLGPALLGPATAVEAWNRADPERSKAYDDVPNYIKDRGVVIMLPGAPPTDAKGEPKPQYVVLNLRQYAPLVGAVRETYDRVTGRDTRTAASLLQGAAQQLSPVSSFGQMLPPGITTGAELAANRDLYRGADIATSRNDARASALAGAAATGINDVLGTRVRPSQADYAIRDLSGGVGDMASSASNIVAGRTTGSGTPQDIPVIGGFARRLVRGDTGQVLQDARDARLSPALQRGLADAGLPPDVAVVGAEYRGIPLQQREQAVYQQATNQHLEETLGPILKAPWFAKLPPAEKKKVVEQMVDAARKMAGAEVMKAVPTSQIGDRVRKKAS